AKGPLLLGVRFVIAQSYERIHRSNLVGMGVLPLQYLAGDSAASLGLDGTETYSVRGLGAGIAPGQRAQVDAVAVDGPNTSFEVTVRIDAQAELDAFMAGGILRLVLAHMAGD
ncbi:MAG TPA: aconitate hydratase, partial [Actinomycetota bacterium]|nr:aconitate hydratase [Actinomycetota bacterium]